MIHFLDNYIDQHSRSTLATQRSCIVPHFCDTKNLAGRI